MSNYRPISLLTTFSKVLEKVMHTRLIQYLQTNNVLVPEQSGFRKGIDTENVAFELTDSVLKSINQIMHGGGIFHDSAEAFDCKLQHFINKVTFFLAFKEQQQVGSDPTLHKTKD
jgi:hypothetical protein